MNKYKGVKFYTTGQIVGYVAGVFGMVFGLLALFVILG